MLFCGLEATRRDAVGALRSPGRGSAVVRGLLGESGQLGLPTVGAVEPQPRRAVDDIFGGDAHHELAERIVFLDRAADGGERGGGQLLEPQVRPQRGWGGERRSLARAEDGDGVRHLQRLSQQLVRDVHALKRIDRPFDAPSRLSPMRSRSALDHGARVVDAQHLGRPLGRQRGGQGRCPVRRAERGDRRSRSREPATPCAGGEGGSECRP